MTDQDMIAFLRARLDVAEAEAEMVKAASPDVRLHGEPLWERLAADVEFKQQILDLYETDPSPDLHAVVWRLALLFRDHPDYRQEWTP